MTLRSEVSQLQFLSLVISLVLVFVVGTSFLFTNFVTKADAKIVNDQNEAYNSQRRAQVANERAELLASLLRLETKVDQLREDFRAQRLR